MKSFLNRIDQYLLKNYPLVWSTRIHYFFAWWLLGAILIFLALLAENPLEYAHNTTMFGWLSLLSVCGLVLWLVYFFRFNKWKSFGNYKTGESLTFFGLCFLIVGMLVLVPQLRDIARSCRVNSIYTDAELVHDVNAFNLARSAAYSEPQVPNVSVFPRTVSAEYEEMLRSVQDGRDSIVFTHDTIKHFSFSNFERISINSKVVARLHAKGLHVMNGKQIYNFMKANPSITLSISMSDLAKLKLKYTDGREIYHPVYDATYEIERNLEHIVDAKYLPNIFSEENIRINFYIVFCICMLLYVFKNSTLKTFGISAGAAVLLPFLIVLIMLIIQPKHELDGFFVPFLFYLAFAFLALFIFRRNKRNIFHGIALNYFTVCTPFLGVYLCAWYATWLGYQHSLLSIPNSVPYPDVDHYILIGEMIGIPVFIILLEPLFQRLYLRWYALPEE